MKIFVIDELPILLSFGCMVVCVLAMNWLTSQRGWAYASTVFFLVSLLCTLGIMVAINEPMAYVIGLIFLAVLGMQTIDDILQNT